MDAVARFTPNLTTLPGAQRALWRELGAVPPEFVLYGGTALALHLGHRESVDFFGVPQLKRIEPPVTAHDNGLKVATLLDLAGMKAAVVQQRAEAKDYLDLDALIRHGIGLPVALSAAAEIYGETFNPQITLKALSYFGDGDLPSLPAAIQQRLVHAVAEVDLDALPDLHASTPE